MVAADPPLHAFIAHERAHGLALTTSPYGGVRPRIVNAVREIIAEQQEARNYTLPAPPAELADGVVSLV
jgi:Tetracyclin repressor-like, C-terminal domain